eukprot:CAMPEP_0118888784 /NCGR_PEP_ID=MMETSP1166-20130328/7_1 /TAXON_ID=1104430 /ORGANISM="Chrysoreinhardia sp, Strain CCMP3193" /LENGTH=439 /DNA_ID=CAMNT_0006827357 /DNA_START=73 /DNA_END=1392 /DNA_ORIENTATION=+
MNDPGDLLLFTDATLRAAVGERGLCEEFFSCAFGEGPAVLEVPWFAMPRRVTKEAAAAVRVVVSEEGSCCCAEELPHDEKADYCDDDEATHKVVRCVSPMTTASVSSVSSLEEEEVLGEGAFGVVSLSTVGGAAAAVKRLKKSGATADEFREAFEEEARVLEYVGLRGGHRNVVALVAFDVDRRLFALELADGPDPVTFLRETTGATREAAVLRRIVRPVAEAVAFLHSLNVVHNDIKDDNIALVAAPGDDDGDVGVVPKLLDFGLARRHADRPTWFAGGTWGTLAPEKAALNLHPDVILNDDDLRERFVEIDRPTKADVYSFACLLAAVHNRRSVEFHESHFRFVASTTFFQQTRRRHHPDKDDDDDDDDDDDTSLLEQCVAKNEAYPRCGDDDDDDDAFLPWLANDIFKAASPADRPDMDDIIAAIDAHLAQLAAEG